MTTIAILLPAHDEAQTIAQTVAAFSAIIPGAEVYVCDNDSSDDTADLARGAGAHVLFEPRKGKGYAVKRLLAAAHADVYVLCDADLTYEAEDVPAMIHALQEGRLAMITGVRQSQQLEAYRPGHRWGNRLFNRLFTSLFGQPVRDVFSGLRVMSHAFVKSLPVGSAGFEIETELSATAAALGVPTDEMPVRYGARPAGSVSKLSTYRDGARILRAYVRLFSEHRPIKFYGMVAIAILGVALGLGVPLIVEFARTGLVPKLPTAVLVMGLVVLSGLSSLTGLVLDAIARLRWEGRQLAYLQHGKTGAVSITERKTA